MLPPEADRIATPQAGIEQHVEPNPLPCADRPAPLVRSDILLSPRAEAVILRALWVDDVRGRINFDELGIQRPPEEAAHGVEEMARLRRRLRPPLAPGHDGVAGDFG